MDEDLGHGVCVDMSKYSVCLLVRLNLYLDTALGNLRQEAITNRNRKSWMDNITIDLKLSFQQHKHVSN